MEYETMDSRVLPARASSALCSVWWLAILLGSILALAMLWLTNIPLGIPGEWTWDRPVPESDLPWNLVGGAIAAALISTFIYLGWQRFEALSVRSSTRFEIATWLASLVILNFAWLWIVQEVAPSKNRLGKSAFVLFFPSSSGYFTRARYDSPRASILLAGYEDLMREGDVLHTGTHPPGLFLVFHGLIALCESSSQFSAFLDATQPTSFREACDVITSNNQRHAFQRPFLNPDRRVLWLATLLVLLSASLTVVPLYGLLSRNITPSTAWLCAALWPAIPAVAIFVPKSDVVFPFISVTLMCVWLFAWDRRSLVLSFLAGIIAWCGLICSLAFLPVFLATGILTLGTLYWGARPDTGPVETPSNSRMPCGTKGWLCLVAGVVGFALPTIAFWQATQLNLLNVWWLNYRNHAGFYQQFTRTYWKWLVINPVELSFAAGFPVAMLGLIAIARIHYRVCREGVSAARFDQVGVPLSLIFVWGLLWLTGKNSGEAARLWILLIPWLVWLMGLQVDTMLIATPSSRFRRLQVLTLLALQFTTCLLTVARVSGFQGDQG